MQEENIVDNTPFSNNNSIVIIKMAIKSDMTSQYISVLIFLGESDNVLIDCDFSISDNIYFFNETNLDRDWTSIDKAIKANKRKDLSEYEDTLYLIEKKLEEILNEDNIREILEYRFKRTLSKLFQDEMIALVDDKKALFLSDIQVTSEDRFSESYKIILKEEDLLIAQEEEAKRLKDQNQSIHSDNPSDSSDDELQFKESNPNFNTVKSNFFLSPVTGIPVSALRPGDLLLMKVGSKTLSEQRVITSLKGEYNENDKTYSVGGRVVQTILNKENKHVVIIKFIEGVYSVIVEDQPVKVQLYTPSAKRSLRNKKVSTPKWLISLLLFLALWIVALIIISIYLF